MTQAHSTADLKASWYSLSRWLISRPPCICELPASVGSAHLQHCSQLALQQTHQLLELLQREAARVRVA